LCIFGIVCVFLTRCYLLSIANVKTSTFSLRTRWKSTIFCTWFWLVAKIVSEMSLNRAGGGVKFHSLKTPLQL